MNISVGMLVTAALVWLGLLFGIALLGDRKAYFSSARFQSLRWPVVYSLSLAVYCTAWTFYGTTTQAAQFGWPIPPTFIGTILIFIFGWPFLMRLVELSKRNNSTSIADFIASRFGKSSVLAASVTLVAVLGIVPYIALQLKAVVMSFAALTNWSSPLQTPAASWLWQDLALWVALMMAVFAILFGTRRASATEHNAGLVLAMSFESLFKLIAMLALGGFVVFSLFQSPGDWARSTSAIPFSATGSFITLMLLGALAMFTLPHQFHIGVVECRDQQHIRIARWLFPLFLLLISLPILLLARAGQTLLGPEQAASDLYVLMLPLSVENRALALFAFLGGLSAATGMVILSSLTLSIMIGNHWLTPLLLRRRWSPDSELGISVRLQRRVGIVLVMLLAWAYHRLADATGMLADIGALSFSGLAQLAPAVLLAVYRPGLPPRALLAGIIGGVAVWAYVLLWPLLVEHNVAATNWWQPGGLFGLGELEPLTRAVITSLAINLMLIMLFARSRSGQVADSETEARLSLDMLRVLAERFLPQRSVQSLFSGRDAADLEAALEHELAAVVGSASARLLLDAARRRTPAPLETVAELVGEASAQARFSQEVLSGALENMSQGMCVIDDQLRLVAWNRPYLDLFDYPPELIRVGRPVVDLMQHNLQAGLMGLQTDPLQGEQMIERRLAHMRAGHLNRRERDWSGGRRIEIRGNPMPGGGYVATFTDVTDFRRNEAELKRINETLEQRVSARTREFEQARLEAERASDAKTRFLAAVSHDLVQPLNAAQLMTYSLTERLVETDQKQSLIQISGALAATEDLLEGLLDISRLDAGGLQPRISRFPLDELILQLSGEFALLAERRGLQLRCRSSGFWVQSDPQLLRRILQNFLSNAVRYSHRGGLLLGARARGEDVLVGVWDTGPGIPESSQRMIFEEFHRLDGDRGAPGLGLGLAIADRMARLLGHSLSLNSRIDRGTFFGVALPRVSAEIAPQSRQADSAGGRGQRVLLVDNDHQMLRSLNQLLQDWGFIVTAVSESAQARRCWAEQPHDLLILDYHLDDGHTGLALLRELDGIGVRVPTLLISADHGDSLSKAARTAGCELLHKPIRPLALRSFIRRLLQTRDRTSP